MTATPQLVVRRADHFFSRLAGLLFSAQLPPGHCLLIVPCTAVHTAFMRFAIDVVFLDGAGRIQKIVPFLKPWHVASCSGAWQTLELAAGEAARLELVIGQSLSHSVNRFNQELAA